MPSERSGTQSQVTLRAVAAHAGVSKSLVSRVLQNSPHVSPERREAVNKAIQELGYRPNGTARSLTQRRTSAVGVLINDLRQPWFVDFLEGLNGVLHDGGLHTFLGDGRLDRSADERLLRAFMETPVDGLVLAGTMPGSATITEAAAWLPTVVAGNRDFTLPHTDVVAQDDALGVVLALEHLYELGHRRIGYIAGPRAQIFTIRRKSYQDWMASRGLQRYVRISECDTTEAGGHMSGRALLDVKARQRPTAIVAANDLSCVGAMSAADELGLSVPADVSFVGFDNSHLARMRRIGLTSVDVAPREAGSLAAARLLERIADPSLPAREHLLTPTLDVRGSTSAPRTA
jgi:DNA-binding LacI/PurR family transcriptional regulator